MKQKTCWNMLDYNHWNIRVDDLWNIGETLGFSALTTKVRCKPKDGPHSLVVIFIFLRLFRHISRLLLISSWYDFLGYSDATTAGQRYTHILRWRSWPIIPGRVIAPCWANHTSPYCCLYISWNIPFQLRLVWYLPFSLVQSFLFSFNPFHTIIFVSTIMV